jgi:hypothetical protein
MDSFEDLARKVQVLERELAVQQQAMDKLKRMGTGTKHVADTAPAVVRKTA